MLEIMDINPDCIRPPAGQPMLRLHKKVREAVVFHQQVWERRCRKDFGVSAQRVREVEQMPCQCGHEHRGLLWCYFSHRHNDESLRHWLSQNGYSVRALQEAT